MDSLDKDAASNIPLKAWPRLVHILNKFALTKHQARSSDEEATLNLLKHGESIKIPRTLRKEGEDIPYALRPTQAALIIHACINFIYWKASKQRIPQGEDLTVIKGAMFLAEQLFHHALSTPDGRFHLHYFSYKNNTQEILPFRHTQNIKSLANSLLKYQKTLVALANHENKPISFPPLYCTTLVKEELAASKAKFELLLAQGFKGDINDSSDSLDALQENKGFLPTASYFDGKTKEEDISDREDGFLDTDEENNPNSAFSGMDFSDSPENNQPIQWGSPNLEGYDRPKLAVRGNISSTPKNWVWDYEQDPLEYILEYTAQKCQEPVEHAISNLVSTPPYGQINAQDPSKVLIINPKNKNNPDNYWKCLKSLTSGVSTQESENQETLEKLDCARFSLSLTDLNTQWVEIHKNILIQELLYENCAPTARPPSLLPVSTFAENLNLLPWDTSWEKNKSNPVIQEAINTSLHGGPAFQKKLIQFMVEKNLLPPLPASPINHTAFMVAFLAKVNGLALDNSFALKLRNDILIETFQEIPKADGTLWSQQESEIWLEHLQTKGVGTYENSSGMEKKREEILSLLNKVYSTIDATPEKAAPVLYKLAENLHPKLAGVCSQAIRRELRSQLNTLKSYAELRGDKQKSYDLQALVAFMSSISSKVKSQEWYTNKLNNIKTLSEILITIFHEPKRSRLFFPGSKKPEDRDPLEITLDFLKSFPEGECASFGKLPIQQELLAFREDISKQPANNLQESLTQISKNLKLRGGSHQNERDLTNIKSTLESSLHIAKTIHNSSTPMETMDHLVNNALEIVKYAHNAPPPIQMPLDSEELSIWETQTIVDNTVNTCEMLANSNRNKAQDIKALDAATQQLSLSIAVLSLAKFETAPQEQKFLESIQNLEKEVASAWKNNYLFWKGLQGIAKSIKARKDSEDFQVSSSGEATLNNMIAIAKAKSENRTAGVFASQETPMQSKMFQITTIRSRFVHWGVSIPIALWLAKDTKGKVTKINKKDFELALENRIANCQKLLTTSDLETTLQTFKDSQQEQIRLLNLRVLTNCLLFLQNTNEVPRRMDWKQKNSVPTRGEILVSGRSHSPECTPNKTTIKESDILPLPPSSKKESLRVYNPFYPLGDEYLSQDIPL